MVSDLISRDAVLEHMKAMAGCQECDHYNYVRCRACSWDDAMNIVEEAENIDAIPVSWLDSKQFGAPTQNSTAAWRVMNMWKEENKTYQV